MQERNILTQNVLGPCQFVKNFSYYNNGFKVRQETKVQFLERMQRIHTMLNPYFTDDTIALFQEIHSNKEISLDEVKTALLGNENKDRFNGGYDVGIYWGKNYTLSKAPPNRWKVLHEHELVAKDKDDIPKTIRSRYAQLKKDREITNVYSFHGFFVKNDLKQLNIENICVLIFKILAVCKGERSAFRCCFNRSFFG